MAGLKGFIFGQDVPKPDRSAVNLQREQLEKEASRERELDAERAAELRNLSSRTRGRALLAFADRGGAARETVG